MKEFKIGMGRRGVRFMEDGREWRLTGLFYADDLVLDGESEEDLRVMVGQFAEVCRRRELKVKAGMSKVVLNREEGLEREVHIDRINLEHVSKFKYLGRVWHESGTDGAECNRTVVSERRVACAIRSLVNDIDLQLECTRVFHETLLVTVLISGSEIMLWNK